MQRDATDALIVQIYRAATGREPWEKVLAAVADACGAFAVQLLAIDKRSSTLSSSAALFSHVAGAARPEHHLDYLRKYQHVDPRALLVVSPRDKDWFHCHEHVNEQQVADSEFYQDFLIPIGGRYLSAVPIYNDDSMGVMLCVIRGVGKTPLEPSVLEWLDSIRPHFTEAMATYRHQSALHAQSLAGQAILDRLRHPVLLVDATHRLRFANAMGQAALAAESVMRAIDGKIQACNAADHQALVEALDSLVIAAPQIGVADRRFIRLQGSRQNDRYGVSVSALRPSETGGAFGILPLAMLVLHDGNREAVLDPFVLQEMYDLTPAEADVGIMLVGGHTLEQIAAKRHVSITTVRSQLRGILSKTGSRRQSDLVRRLVSLPHEFTL